MCIFYTNFCSIGFKAIPNIFTYGSFVITCDSRRIDTLVFYTYRYNHDIRLPYYKCITSFLYFLSEQKNIIPSQTEFFTTKVYISTIIPYIYPTEIPHSMHHDTLLNHILLFRIKCLYILFYISIMK